MMEYDFLTEKQRKRIERDKRICEAYQTEVANNPKRGMLSTCQLISDMLNLGGAQTVRRIVIKYGIYKPKKYFTI